MSAIATPSAIENDRGGYLCLNQISWETYVKIGELLAERSTLRMNYDRGRLEIMTISTRHEWIKRLLGTLVMVISEELNIPRASCGSMTCRRQDLQRGFEPDECFYIGEAVAALTSYDLDLESDPPPNLSIEVDITHGSIDRQPLYASLGIRELWRYDNGRVVILHLQADQTYLEVSNSIAFPTLTATDVNRQLNEFVPGDENVWVNTIRQWVRDELAAR